MITTTRKLTALAGAFLLGAAVSAQAADAPAAKPATAPAAPAPVLVSGASARMLAETCAGCHGTDGASVGPASPTLAGMNSEYFTELMQSFRDGKVYSTVMGRIAKGYSDEELVLMAGYFNGKPYVAADQKVDEKLVAKGKKLHDKFCEKCHTEGGKPLIGLAKGEPKVTTAGTGKEDKVVKEEKEEEDGDEDEAGDEEYQILAGQWTPYLHYALEDFRADRREMPKKMKSKLNDLLTKEGEGGLMALYAFYASEK
ncbi:MAG TPA: c-type cytochrome [Lamprocystis sp. (in: g-proteobacteria)]|nr:c-type cytochrome [Lamprocystis sp. (in: g-proteobacteria)]